jgi:hypothetical protein
MTTTQDLMREGLPTMRDMIAEVDEISVAETHPLADYTDSLSALADAVAQGDEPVIMRFEATLLADPALRARPELERIPPLDDETAYVEGVAGVLYLFRDETYALTDDGHIVHLGDFTPTANRADVAAAGEEVVYVEAGDWIEYGDDGAHGPVRTDDAYWAMVDWADDEDLGGEDEA